MDDEIVFAEDIDDKPCKKRGTWKVLIVDDEPQVHAVTRLALNDFVFLNKGLEFVSAYSGAEAQDAFVHHSDIAIVFLDVVMETDDAGLKVADFIRNHMNNHFTRIILRTGQPGQAPERDVIINYDINDYKSKTEFTAQKLFTVVISALRSYRDIMLLEENRLGLEKVISASKDLFSRHSLEHFVEGLLQQLTSFLGGTEDAAYLTSAVAGPLPIDHPSQAELYVFSGKGLYEGKVGEYLEQVVSGKELESCQRALNDRCVVYEDEYLVAYCKGKSQRGSLLYLSGLPKKLNKSDRRLVEMFSQNVQVAFDNVLFSKESEETQQEIILRLGQISECDPGQIKHVKLMLKLAQLLGEGFGLNQEQLTTLGRALPLYDIGKIKFPIPAQRLYQPAPVDEEHASMIKQHTQFAYQLLKGSQRLPIQAAAVVVKEHHEYWNGKGLPLGLAGENIHIYSRIVSLADTLAHDLVGAQRPMGSEAGQNPCSLIKTDLQQIIEQKGRQFDPQLVDILCANLQRVEQILITCSNPR